MEPDAGLQTQGGTQVRFFILIISALLMLGPPAMAQKWPTTQFEVLNVDGSGLWAKPEVSTVPYPDASELKKLEDFLAFSAVRLEAWGFPAPDMEVNTTARCAKCYHIYMSDLAGWLDTPGSGTRGYADNVGWSFAHGKYTVVNIDRRYATSTDLKVVQPRAYTTVVHEMIHPILNQTRYAYDRAGQLDGNKRVGDWIKEGIPDAIAYYLYTEYFKDQPPGRIENWVRFYGSRAYEVPLGVRDKNTLVREENVGYASSSFWRYLAELHYNKKHDPIASLPGPNFEPADFSYLVELLAQTHLGNSQRDEYVWLDHTLASSRHIGQSLTYILPRFYATIAGYWDHRAQSQYTNKGSVDRDKWMLALFNRCHRINLTTRQMSNEVSIEIPELAATCLYIDVTDATSNVNVDIQVRTEADDGPELLKQLWLGTPGGQTVSQPTDGASKVANGHQVVWISRPVIKPGVPTAFILSNVGSKSYDTKPFTGTLRVSMTIGATGATGANAPKGAALDVAPGPDGREDAAIQRAEAYGTSLSEWAGMTASAQEMNIMLGMSPDILNVLGDAGGSGGLLDQVLVSGAAMLANQTVFDEATAAAMEYKQTTPGAEVDILLPPLELGFTGTISNVRIRSSGGPGPDRFTVGPKDTLQGPGTHFEPSGTVIITEYSPWVLTGRYHGQLVDPDNLDEDQRRQSQPVLDVLGEANGVFSISAPWFGDERYERIQLADPWADLEADLKNRLPAVMTDMVSEMTQEAKRASETGRTPDFSSAIAKAAPPAESCDCSCAGLAAIERMGEAVDAAGRAPTRSELDLAACGLTCARQWAVCEGEFE